MLVFVCTSELLSYLRLYTVLEITSDKIVRFGSGKFGGKKKRKYF